MKGDASPMVSFRQLRWMHLKSPVHCMFKMTPSYSEEYLPPPRSWQDQPICNSAYILASEKQTICMHYRKGIQRKLRGFFVPERYLPTNFIVQKFPKYGQSQVYSYFILLIFLDSCHKQVDPILKLFTIPCNNFCCLYGEKLVM